MLISVQLVNAVNFIRKVAKFVSNVKLETSCRLKPREIVFLALILSAIALI